jgi:hypothetical protein
MAERMKASEGGHESDLLAHPLAGHVAGLLGLKVDGLSEADQSSVALDVLRLLDAAEGRVLPEVHEALAAVREIQRNIDGALRAASSLPEHLADQSRCVQPTGPSISDMVSDLKANLHHKLNLAERVAAAEADRYPVKRGRKPEFDGQFAADVGADIYWRRTGKFPTTGQQRADGVSWTSGYFNFLDCVLSELKVGKDVRTWGGNAVQRLKAKRGKSLQR